MERNPSDNPAHGPHVPSYRFARRPRWLLSHLLVLALVALMLNLGFWQLRRLDERRAFNDTVEANAIVEPQRLPPRIDEAGLVEWRRFTVTGEYAPGSDVLVANRTLDGQPGYWIVSLLRPNEQEAPVAIVRGFITRTLAAGDDLGAVTAPSGEVTVTGYAQDSRGGGRFATGTDVGPPEISRVDIEALAEHWGTDLLPIWLQLSEQQPALQGDALTPVPLPELDEGPHLSYAVQWFIFSTIAVVGYPLILRRNAHAGPDNDVEGGGGDDGALAGNGARLGTRRH
jgi:surfeit locus 1 family protein